MIPEQSIKHLIELVTGEYPPSFWEKDVAAINLWLQQEHGFFPVTAVCRDDIPEAFGFPKYKARAEKLANKLTDDDMKDLASSIGEQCCESDVYWHAINDWMVDRFGKDLEE